MMQMNIYTVQGQPLFIDINNVYSGSHHDVGPGNKFGVLGVSIIHSVADQFFPGACVRSLPLTERSRLFSHSRDGSS
jgi:hypothetical protein